MVTTPSKKYVPEGTYKIAEQLVHSGKIEQAKQLCQMILAATPEHVSALHLLGTILANNKQLSEAEQLVIKAVKLCPNSYKINSTLAYIYRLLNKSELANVHAKRAAQGRFYTDWIKQFDTLKESTINTMRTNLTQWNDPPKISIVISVYNTNSEWLHIAIDSVINQIYPHWELCIADDASTLPYIHPMLENYAQQDTRIKIHFRSTNGGIAATSNDALALATGNYVAFLDHNDILPIHALYFVANEIITYPHAMLIYSDEDKLNELEERTYSHFKPDWNPDLFLSHNFISHLAVYKTILLQKIGGFRENYVGVQDYDLALRAIEHIKAENILHIPHILYHQRIHKNIANLLFVGVKSVACNLAKKALSEHLERIGKVGYITESYTLPGTFRVQYKLPNTLPLVSIIIPTHNKFELLRVCIGSILAKTSYSNFEIIIVDNQSDDPNTLFYLEQLQQESLANVIKYSHPFNYSAINNFAVKHARGELLCLLNNDVEVINNDWLTEMVSHAIRPEIGAVGAKLWYGNNTLQHGGVIIGLGGVADHSHKYFPRNHSGYFGRMQMIQNLSAVTGACMVMRKETFNTVGELNSTDLIVAFNDVDLCLKIISAGLRIVWTPFAELYHHESMSRGRDDTSEKKARFDLEIAYMKKRWSNTLINDPAYNPNLAVDNNNFGIAWPPRVHINKIALF